VLRQNRPDWPRSLQNDQSALNFQVNDPSTAKHTIAMSGKRSCEASRAASGSFKERVAARSTRKAGFTAQLPSTTLRLLGES